MKLTNQLRREGTAHLIGATRKMGIRRFVAESISFGYDPGDGTLREETDPLWERPPKEFATALEAIRVLEHQTQSAGGTILRFGHLYGPGTAFAPDGAFVHDLLAGKLPIVGKGRAVFSFIHTQDAASAILAALDGQPGGMFNIVDDTPVTASEWMTWLAETAGGPVPRRIPRVLARLFAGQWGVAYLDQLVGRLARQHLHWKPGHSDFKQAVAQELARTLDLGMPGR